MATVLTGCSDHKQRFALLEQRNRDLSAQLDKVRGELRNAAQYAADADQFATETDRRLLASVDEADRLRARLEEMSVQKEAPPGWTAVPGGAMIAIEGSVLFASGKAELRAEAERTLDALASTIKAQYPDKDILVFGHTDNAPIKTSTWADNWQLSTERALAVVRALQQRRLPPARLAACGCGEFRPLGDNVSDASRTRNRRVEIFALDAQPRTGRP